MCVCVFICLVTCGSMLEQAQSLNISDCFPCLSFSVWLCVWGCLCKCLVGDGCVICPLCVFVCVTLDPAVSLSCPVLSCLRLVLSPGSTLSAQSVPTMYPGQLALLAPGGLADSSSSTLLQPLKPSPSSNNLCSAYTSEGALSVPSLCAPTPGRRVTEKCHSAAELTSFPTT